MALIKNNHIESSINSDIDTTDSKTTVLLNYNTVKVGVNTHQIITKLDDDGIFRQHEKIEGQTIFDNTLGKGTNWFFLDVETGQRGWFPGCKVIGHVNNDTKIYIDESADSEILATLTSINDVKINTILDDLHATNWYNITYQDITGFININDINYIEYRH